MMEFVLAGPKQIVFREYSEPPLKPDEVRVQTVLTGLKHGTEMAMYEGKTPFATHDFDPEYRLFREKENQQIYPLNLGSWGVGRVTETGADVRGFSVGELVLAPMPHRPTNVVRPPRLYRLGDIDPQMAIFTDPAIFALSAVHDAQISLGDHVAIFGMGAIGLLAVQFARMSGASVIAVDLLPERLALAAQLGATAVLNPAEGDVALHMRDLTGRKGVDTAIEISGSLMALQQAVRSARPCGRVVAASYYKGQMPFEFGAEWHHNRLTMISSMPVWGMPHRRAPLWDLARMESTILALMREGRLVTAPLLGHVFPYASAAEAYALIAEKPNLYIKTAFTYGEADGGS
ncbi:MAG: zinc-binding alcohol dehydrogenase [Pleurocapsa minor GSE-CHR-MK-17-07R]|jgi:threonine dehydrogenase-like Zn-dependent dehydrogenase|nr:zinc-binding alcohol dehydrogenase [Pleurocapsa minor GSE-CHR-MK 17-07R]